MQQFLDPGGYRPMSSAVTAPCDAGVLSSAACRQAAHSSALLTPASLAMLGAGYSGPARGRAIGTWAAAGAISGGAGPVIGGWLIDTAGWRAIFLLNLPIAWVAMWLAIRYIEETRDRSAGGPLDWVGASLATFGLGAVAWSLP